MNPGNDLDVCVHSNGYAKSTAESHDAGSHGSDCVFHGEDDAHGLVTGDASPILSSVRTVDHQGCSGYSYDGEYINGQSERNDGGRSGSRANPRMRSSVTSLPSGGKSSTRPSNQNIDIVTQLRFEAILSNLRASGTRRSLSVGSTRQSSAGRKLMLDYLMEREFRRRDVRDRASVQAAQGEEVLVTEELKKEKAALNRYVKLENEKVNKVVQHRTVTESRLAMARRRRMQMERDRQYKLDGLREQWEKRLELSGSRTVSTARGVRPSFKI
ncbi:uncharacterized protein TEOVI_000719400 [Trypanosoma equiperdum]|uniref:Uncharacterized protein n=4 Tax=Trypanozoon TaxID=39700 RepID=Q382K9_TRYB2|nr:hypothetical protein, conserved [Trypanosoma brucei gambiense DAL972]XP_829384.1 hypothetical protein, conserved [Trypanosoma brucei brucei TREU927]RHW67478.1 hypothetical protein DPX39_110110700 [Trypanosoma brucei equiperdum]SCU66307.1 hypothetical protein, conserved [Trypanosoma equiperdum]EAN80272.1 hypothetical protein, conserved [Trypanosoma brucei brucei TREU927]CBH18362.1 hypothetical protein, conserved [Trypanosoma brucei gambiense DAL972]|eukprot:XP_011780626.1 hypothetical protein, conserved [Trypanosoma brucei gambiense DAL972]